MNQIHMARVVGGKRYSTKSATLIASNVYWDGNNFERSGRNTWLYKTRLGAFFAVHGTKWQGEQDTLEPLSREDAIELFEGSLSEHEVKWADAFDEEPGEPEPAGRPTLHGQPMVKTGFFLTSEQIQFLKSQPEGMGETVRLLIDEAMKKTA